VSSDRSRSSTPKFLKRDIFKYLRLALQSNRRRYILYGLLAVTLTSGFFDTLNVPILSTISFLSACGMVAFLGYILLAVLPSGWKDHPEYRLVAWWLIVLGVALPLVYWGQDVFNWLAAIGP